jgi:hypothetical protein
VRRIINFLKNAATNKRIFGHAVGAKPWLFMDKRLIILMAVALLGSSGFFAYRKLVYKPEGIRYTIKPRTALRAGDSISFEDQTPDASRWKWDFGDGEFSVKQSGHHIYLTPGQYKLSLTAYGPFGMLKQHDTVLVSGDILAKTTTPGILGPSSVIAGAPASWQSAASAEHYEWSVEGDPALARNAQNGAAASFTFKTPGRKTLVLKTQNPNATVRQEVLVAAAAEPVRPKPAVIIPMPPHQAAHARPAHPQHQQQQRGNKLEDLGGPVEIKK